MTQPAPCAVRELSGLAELALTPTLARAIWGETDRPEDAVLLHVVQHIGGLVAGAFDAQGALQAYLVGLPTSEAGVHHSHRLGVHPGARRQGLGERLKRFQRDWCLSRGVHEVRWTFDPLLLANAHLNIHRLGATVSTLLPDYYGAMSGINAGLPSDRFEAHWELGSGRVERHLNGQTSDQSWPTAPALHPLHARWPAELADAVALEVPRDFGALRRDDPELALDWRLKAREGITALFGLGYTLTDVDLGRSQYLFTRAPAHSGTPC
ncbi:GNAT family N-acetyltransferase [Deinococcus sp. Arct2-2]|uniref:GNAT family N-acetyltransferase n=1 Tax=Deinococcus sp. Arct2-2 TaxID=2568653 RepID=UPI0010A3225C|nr:GNAT family N-acetyltransferase [Deinococcus sp. Arct2-2]THF70195.1 GNAT family N-acetyltransferase [Deinococcus sp. Arct2-2]